MTAAATPASPPRCSIVEFIGAELDKHLAGFPDERARWRELCLQWNCWNLKYGRFVAASVLSDEMPREFYFGPHAGWISAADFVIILTDIDARKSKIERAQPADVPTVQSPRLVVVGDHTPERADV